MQRQHLHTGRLCHPSDSDRVAVCRIPTGPIFQRHRHVDRLDHRLHDPPHERLVPEQGRTAGDLADLARRAAHVQVDDLRAAVDVVAGGVGQHCGIGAYQLHHDRRRLAVVIEPTRRLAAGPHARVGCHHLAHRVGCTQPPTQPAKWPVRDSSHRRSEYAIFQLEGADAHLMNGSRKKKLENHAMASSL